MNEKKIILGIETSCDETAVSIIEENKNGKIKILSNVVSSQIDIPFCKKKCLLSN